MALIDNSSSWERLPFRVALDVWGISSPQPRGIVNLKRQYARACARLAQAGALKLCYAGTELDQYWLNTEGLLGRGDVFRRFRIPGRLHRILAVFRFFPFRNLLANSDLYHSFGTYGFNNRHIQVVGTLVDFVPMRVPQFVPLAFTLEQVRWCQWAAEHHGAKWIAISEKVKQDALQLARLRDDQVQVVKLGAEGDMFVMPAEEAIASTLRGLRIHQPYILCVNTFNPRKNHDRLLDAWQRGGFAGQGWMLVLVGHPAESSLPQEVDSGRFQGVRWLGYVSRDELVHLYYGCDVFAYPSLYEGFGIPVAEAIVAGKAVLTSRSSAMASIAGQGALCVDPWDTTSICNGLRDISGSESLRMQLAAHNKAQREEYSIDRLAVDLLEAYRRFLC